MIVGAMTLDGWLQFQQVNMVGGYVKDEVERMMRDKNG